jgi:hypothetical protein
MPRFFFHVRDSGELTQDVEGIDFPNLEAAQDEARMAARQLLAEQTVSVGVLSRSQQFEIRDEDGQLLATMPFADTIELQQF